MKINVKSNTIVFLFFACGIQIKPKLRRVKAMYDCVADHHDELTFNEGEVLVVLGEEDADWWVSI